MKYKPKPSKNFYCYDGPLLLRQFGPDPNDAADVLETYPWCVLAPCVSHQRHKSSDWEGTIKTCPPHV